MLGSRSSIANAPLDGPPVTSGLEGSQKRLPEAAVQDDLLQLHGHRHAQLLRVAVARLRAGLDVFEQEPLPIDSPLLGFDNVVLVPHLGSATAATREAMFRLAVGNLIAGMSGAPLPHCANPVINH